MLTSQVRGQVRCGEQELVAVETHRGMLTLRSTRIRLGQAEIDIMRNSRPPCYLDLSREANRLRISSVTWCGLFVWMRRAIVRALGAGNTPE